MKRFLVLATAAVSIFTGCTKQFVDEPIDNGSQAMVGFDTYIANSTKGVAKGGFIMGDQFFVYGGKTGVDDFTVGAPVFSSWLFSDAGKFPQGGALVSNYGGTPNVWRYDNPVAWDNEKVTFFGFSPVPQGAETYGITYAAPVGTTAIPTIDFEVKGGYAATEDIKSAAATASRPFTKQQVDLMWVTTANQTKANRTVEMMFKHALTRLNFAIRSNAPIGHSIRINSIALKNVATKGTLTLAHDESKKGDMNYVGGWAIDGTAAKKNFAVNLINSVASLIKDNDVHTITDNDEALMMIPQSLAGIELEVCYASSADGINWENYESGVPVTVQLDQLAASHWNPNKQIRYTLNITPGEVIGFNAQVENWGNETDVEFISKAVGKDAQAVHTLALADDDKISLLNACDWITYAEGANAAKPISAEVTAVAGNYTFEVTKNISTVARENQIIINHADGNKTVIKVSQGAGDGIIKAPIGAGEVATFTLAAGDKITVPQTKAVASWIFVNGKVISADYTAEGEAKISVEANTGVARAATFDVTIGGATTTYTIAQDGIVPVDVTVAVAADGTFTPAVDLAGCTISAIVDGTWLKVDGNAIADGAISGAGVLTADINAGAARTAKFTATKGSVVTNYTVNQAAVAPAEVPVALPNAGGEVLATTSFASGDIIEVISGDVELEYTKDAEPAAILTGKIEISATETYAISAKANATLVAKTGVVRVTKAGVVTNYNVTVAAFVPVPTPEAVVVAMDGTYTPLVTLAGETISDLVNCDWVHVDSNAMSEGAATGDITIDANVTGNERVATFTATSADGLTVKEYTFTQAGA